MQEDDERRNDPADETVGKNLRVLREQRQMSQSALATAMTDAGIQWHQQTVGRIEAGRQPVRVAELVTLARMFGVSLDRFTWQLPEAAEYERVVLARDRLRRAYEVTANNVRNLLAAQDWARAVIAECHDSEHERVRHACKEAAYQAETCTAEAAVAAGSDRYAEDVKGIADAAQG